LLCSANIAVDGQLIPCCHDYGRECLLGNVLEKPLAALLRDAPAKMKEFAQNTDRFLCHRCERLQ
jgi:radical SAM protein with 4Fe4S-binding SPASM domain